MLGGSWHIRIALWLTWSWVLFTALHQPLIIDALILAILPQAAPASRRPILQHYTIVILSWRFHCLIFWLTSRRYSRDLNFPYGILVTYTCKNNLFFSEEYLFLHRIEIISKESVARLSHTLQNQNRVLIHFDEMLCFFIYRMDALRSRSNATLLLIHSIRNVYLIHFACLWAPFWRACQRVAPESLLHCFRDFPGNWWT